MKPSAAPLIIAGIVIGGLWLVAGKMAAMLFLVFLLGCVVTLTLVSMTSGNSVANAKALTEREKSIGRREAILSAREATITKEIGARAQSLAQQQLAYWKAEIEARGRASQPQVMIPQPHTWREEDL